MRLMMLPVAPIFAKLCNQTVKDLVAYVKLWCDVYFLDADDFVSFIHNFKLDVLAEMT